MQTKQSKILEIQQAMDGTRRIQVEFEDASKINSGQYFLVTNPQDTLAPLPHTLFPSGVDEGSCTLFGAIPPQWQPGTPLSIRGPLGKGFTILDGSNQIALVGFDAHTARLEMLMQNRELELALFMDAAPQGLPIWVEVNPLSSLNDAAKWANQIFIDYPNNDFKSLHEITNNQLQRFASKTQILVAQPMPCGGQAQCGVCAVQHPGTHKAVYPCETGPVITL